MVFTGSGGGGGRTELPCNYESIATVIYSVYSSTDTVCVCTCACTCTRSSNGGLKRGFAIALSTILTCLYVGARTGYSVIHFNCMYI